MFISSLVRTIFAYNNIKKEKKEKRELDERILKQLKKKHLVYSWSFKLSE